VGTEYARGGPASLKLDFYGSSFVADASGGIVAEAPRSGEAVILARFDLAELQRARAGWFVFRDRRPDLYQPLSSFAARTNPDNS
jgi:N-carbamoylputrescine amidase